MKPEARVSRTLLGWMTLGEWRAHPWRLLVAVLAVSAGVALGLAVHLVNRSALDEFAQGLQAVRGGADLQVHATTAAGFDEALYPKLARVPGVAAVSPGVELSAGAPGLTGPPLTLLGLDVLRAAQATPALVGRRTGPGADQATAFDPRGVFLSAAALEALRLAPGGRIHLSAAGRSADFVVVGTLPGVEEQRLAVIDIAEAQWRFGQLGRLQRLDVRLAADADRPRTEAAIRRLLPADAELVSARSEAQRADSLSRAYRVNLQMLAMVALLTGGFLVYSAQALSAARRRPQFALLRVLGLPRRGMLAQLVVEGLLLGAAGSLLGLAFGVGLAELALRLWGGDLGGGYFAGAQPRLAFAPVAALVIGLLGVAAAVGGSLLPALDAARAQPAVALTSAPGEAGDPRRAPSARLGLALLAAGALAALAPPVGGLPLFGYGAIALMLAGGVATMPWLARTLLQPLRRWRDPPPAAALAVDRLWGAPAQAAVALCGIVASTSLMIAMAVMVASFRGSVDEWLTQVLPSDLYLRVEGAGGGLGPDLQRRLAATAGVAGVEFRQVSPLRLSPERPPVALIARAEPGRSLPRVGRARTPPPGATPAWISEPFARLYGRQVGDRFVLPVGRGGATEVVVAGVWRDYSRQFGAVVLNAADYQRLTGDASRSEAAIELAPGASAPQVAAALKAALPPDLAPRVSLAEPRQLRAAALRIFDRSFAVTYALEAIAILVGLAGVAATFSAQTLARRKEFGMLRHLGVQRRQIVRMLACEGALLGAVGAVAGGALGAAMSQVLIQVVNPQSFHWTMQTRLPWPLFASLAVALVATAAVTAVLAGRGALGESAVLAVREDW